VIDEVISVDAGFVDSGYDEAPVGAAYDSGAIPRRFQHDTFGILDQMQFAALSEAEPFPYRLGKNETSGFVDRDFHRDIVAQDYGHGIW
jgi:hypothetical protein